MFFESIEKISSEYIVENINKTNSKHGRFDTLTKKGNTFNSGESIANVIKYQVKLPFGVVTNHYFNDYILIGYNHTDVFLFPQKQNGVFATTLKVTWEKYKTDFTLSRTHIISKSGHKLLW